MGLPICVRCGESQMGESLQDAIHISTGDADVVCGDCVRPWIDELCERVNEIADDREMSEWSPVFDAPKTRTYETEAEKKALEDRVRDDFYTDLSDDEEFMEKATS